MNATIASITARGLFGRKRVFVLIPLPLILIGIAVLARAAGARVRSAILCETFRDQVNIVQASYGGRRQTLLFTPGDGPKTL